MTTKHTIGDVLRHLRRFTGGRDANDDVLLDQVAARGDPDAFEALVCRHGRLVVGVCRRHLRDPHDVEDAFQATFLVLLKKAGSIRRTDRLSCWLYGVACRVARQLRHRRRDVAPLPDIAGDHDAPREAERHDLRRVLDEEMQRLPEKYRVPVLMCHLQGSTQEQAARQLGCPTGTVATRVRRGLERLRERLVQRGVEMTAPGIAVALTPPAAEVAVPAALISATVCLTDGVEHGLSAVASLAGEASPPWLSSRTILGLAAALAVTAFGAGVFAARAWNAPPPPRDQAVAMPTVQPPYWREQNKFTVWGDQFIIEVLAFDREGFLTVAGKGPGVDGEIPRPKAGPGSRPMVVGEELFHFSVRRIDLSRRDLPVDWDIPARDSSGTPVACITFSPDGKYIAISRAGIDLWWDRDDNEPGKDSTTIRTPTKQPRHLTFHPSSELLAAVGSDGQAAVYDVRTKRAVTTLPGQAGGCRALGFAEDGSLMTVGGTGVVQKWDAATGAPRGASSLPLSATGPVEVFSQARKLAAAHHDKAIGLWDVEQREEVWRLPCPSAPAVLRSSSDGQRLASAHTDGSVILWDAVTGQRLTQLRGPGPRVNALAFTRDSLTLAAGNAAGVVQVWTANR